MSLCVDCLIREQPDWPKRYRRIGLVLALYGLAVFQFPESELAIALQAVFFVAIFTWTLWPLFAARRPHHDHQEKYRG